ncbi:MAG: lecithin retinol acyltransferase family protein [Oscillospiraceae bacterium]|nr:lecithin retinol acyltransferase family protein [Oscillospiraceae bacterium]
MKTMGGKNCWEVIRQNRHYRLQRHLLLRGHCRILDNEDRRIASGSESEMLAAYEELDHRTLRGLPPSPTAPNLRAGTIGGKVFWDEIAEKGGYRLQKQRFFNHCRILDKAGRRLANGSEQQMRALLDGLADGRVHPDTLRGLLETVRKRHRTRGGAYCWDTVRSAGVYRLQRHKLFPGCRILDLRNVCVDYGAPRKMAARFDELAKEAASLTVPVPGDVIGVERALYDHYGVYVSDDEVIEFSAHNPEGKSIIQKTTFARFLADSKECFYLVFGDTYCEPGKVYFSPAVRKVSGRPQDFWKKFRIFADGIRPAPTEFFSRNLGDALNTPKNYRLRSPAETIRRARAQVGRTSFGESEKEYSLHRNNCEHFAIWCKTGVMLSTQAEGHLMRAFRIMADIGAAPDRLPKGEKT